LKKTFYFPHDFHARHDPKLERLRMENGPVTDGIFWDLVEMLYEQNGYLLVSDIPLYAKMLNTNEQMLNKVVTSVFLIDNDRFYNKSLLDRLNHINNVREERREAGISSGKARQKNTCSTNAEHLSNNINKSKVKEIKEKNDADVLEFFNYFLLKTKKTYKLNGARRAVIESRLKDHTLDELKKAVDNFVNDDWPDRHKYIDIVYCIGTRNKVDNLEKWLNYQPKQSERRVIA
jgi:hypothetical protein